MELDICEFVQYLKADGATNITLHVRVRLVDEKGYSIANRSFSQVYEMQTTNQINTLDGYNHCYREFSKEVIGWIGKLRESDAI